MKLFNKFDQIIFGGCLLVLLAAVGLARWVHLAELMTHFMVQALIGCFVLTVLFSISERTEQLRKIAAGAMLIFLASAIWPYLPRDIQKSDKFEELTILQFNLNYGNLAKNKLVGLIKNYEVAAADGENAIEAYTPDILVLQEVSPSIADQLSALAKDYPYSVNHPKGDAFGATVYSKIPIESERRQIIAQGSNQYTYVEIITPKLKIPLTLIEVHTPPPVSPMVAERRNQELAVMAQLMRETKTAHKILIGDLNVTPYSPFFRDLEKQSGLQSAMRAQIPFGTWPSLVPEPLRIPIDHLLLSKNISVISRHVVQEAWGSDHLPVVHRLRLYQHKPIENSL